MTVSPTLRRKVAKLRADSPYPMTIADAVARVRYESRDWSESEYPFLADFVDYTDKPVTGTVGAFEVTVTLVDDHDSYIGEDDVTGTFSDDQDKPDPNAIRCSYAGYNGPRGVRWYIPSTSAVELRDYYLKEGRMSRAQIDDIVRASIERDMRDDADRSYYGVIVTVSADGEQLADASLWSIDTINGTGANYFREVAADLIEEAVSEAQAGLPQAVSRAEDHAAKIRAAIQEA